VLPLAINETTQTASRRSPPRSPTARTRCACCSGRAARSRRLIQTLALAEAISSGLGFEPGRAATIDTDDPRCARAALRAIAPPTKPVLEPSRFTPLGAKRRIQRMALRELQRVAPAPVRRGDAAGRRAVRHARGADRGLHLCAWPCVSACPTGARVDDPDRPTFALHRGCLRAVRLCKATCPEKVIGLTPQLDLRPGAAKRACSKTEEPFPCVRCGKPFGVKSTIERITAKLAGQHWMFHGRRPAPRAAEDVRRLPRHRRDRAGLRSARRPATTVRTTRTICANGRRPEEARRVSPRRRSSPIYAGETQTPDRFFSIDLTRGRRGISAMPPRPPPLWWPRHEPNLLLTPLPRARSSQQAIGAAADVSDFPFARAVDSAVRLGSIARCARCPIM